MCKTFEDMRKEGFIEREVLQRLQNKLGISPEKAQEYYKIYHGKQTVK